MFAIAKATARSHCAAAFTLLELLVVVAIVALLVGLLAPGLGAARQQALGTRCLANLRGLGLGIAIYTDEHRDVLAPGRLPALDNCNAYADLPGGRKFRPTFLAMMSRSVGLPPFADPKACRNEVDRDGEAGDRQNYGPDMYVCPSVREWRDERNGCYGYNYQFLGNSRLRDPGNPTSYKNWPVKLASIAQPARTVAVADALGTAASFAEVERQPYDDDARDANREANEGFHLDPPRVDPQNGEMAGFDDSPQLRTGVHERHRGRTSVLWLDAHGDHRMAKQLGYRILSDGVFAIDGENSLWSGSGADVPWLSTPATP